MESFLRSRKYALSSKRRARSLNSSHDEKDINLDGLNDYMDRYMDNYIASKVKSGTNAKDIAKEQVEPEITVANLRRGEKEKLDEFGLAQ